MRLLIQIKIPRDNYSPQGRCQISGVILFEHKQAMPRRPPCNGTNTFDSDEFRTQALEDGLPFVFCFEVEWKTHIFRDENVSIPIQYFQKLQLWLIMVNILQNDQSFSCNSQAFLKRTHRVCNVVQCEDQKYNIKTSALERQVFTGAQAEMVIVVIKANYIRAKRSNASFLLKHFRNTH